VNGQLGNQYALNSQDADFLCSSLLATLHCSHCRFQSNICARAKLRVNGASGDNNGNNIRPACVVHKKVHKLVNLLRIPLSYSAARALYVVGMPCLRYFFHGDNNGTLADRAINDRPNTPTTTCERNFTNLMGDA